MKQQNVLVTIVGYYLSRFDDLAYSNLGYKTKNEAHLDIGKRLGVAPNSVKNRRDEFDPIHSNKRVGWYQRDLSPGRKKVVEAFQDISELGLREIVISILNNQSFINTENLEILSKQIQNSSINRKPFNLRGQTGKKAEEFYINYHKEFGLPYKGQLKDTRDLGCGYDFEILTSTEIFYVEVKGMDKDNTGIMFTDKEWFMASKHENKYYVVIVSFGSQVPKVSIVENPAEKLNPKKNIFTTIQINWNISVSELDKLILKS